MNYKFIGWAIIGYLVPTLLVLYMQIIFIIWGYEPNIRSMVGSILVTGPVGTVVTITLRRIDEDMRKL